MTLLAPLGLAALLLGIPIVALHMLTPRRPPTTVSSLLHWEGMRESITATEPWQRLRLSLLLFLQLAAVVLLAVALANPATVAEAQLAEHTVFIVDASGSMASIDGSPDRLADAVARARALRGELPDGGLASVVVASVSPVALLVENGDAAAFDRALESITTTAGGADYDAAFALAESLRSADRPTGFILLSDGALNPVQQRLAPLGTRFEPVGSDDTNRAITDLSATAGPGGLQVRVTVESTGGADATQTLRIDVDGRTEASRELTIPAGGVVEEVFEVTRGIEVTASLEGEDLIAADDRRFVATAIPGTLRARINGEGSIFLDELFSAIPGVETSVAPGERVDFEVYAGTAVPGDISVPFIAIDVPGGVPGITPLGRTADPIATSVSDDPLLAGIDMSRLAIVDAQVLMVDAGDVLLAAPGAPLVVRGSIDGTPFFYIAFTLEQSNLPVDVAFPVIGSRMVGELTADEGATAALTVGERLPVGSGGGVSTDPAGSRHVTAGGEHPPVAGLPGFWTVEREGGEALVVAVNADTAESSAAPRSELPELRPAGGSGTGTVVATTSVASSILPWVLAALLVVLGVEIVVSRRRRGVGRVQWRLGLLLRAIIVVLLVLALVDPSFNAADDTVTAVFVADASDSLAGTRAQVASWISSATEAAGGGRWAVVEVGADARVATPVGITAYRPTGAIDGSSTNLGRGLRLGSALLTGGSKERIVLVSDGRNNDGDLAAEVERLSTLGVVVDIHTVPGELRTDAAVASIDAPGLVAEGEAFDTVVEVRSSVAGPATVELTSSDFATRQEVELQPGSNFVAFTTTAGSQGTEELTARVSLDGDTVAQNDTATAGVSIEGAGSVLIVEGSPDVASSIGAALAARGLVVDTATPEALAGIDQLAAYQALVLADVRAGDLAAEQVADIRSFVSDLGRGLVVVGGIASYGLGDYFDTELEALLPVSSEAVDPEREAPVAEVLLIDTSESMGACHCSEDGMTEQEGPNKTDIAKAATMRAFDSLGENDEIGVLAFSAAERWVVELQQSPSRQRVEEAIGGLRPFGETRIIPALRDAAEALRRSNRALRHIVLFTDGFTTELEESGNAIGLPAGDVKGGLVEMAAELAAEGITVSVVGTGEGAIPALERVAEAGNGRFYPGRNLDEIPEIFVEESRLASRAYVNEGEYYPTVTSTAAAVRELAAAPALFGFIATTAKPTAEVQLQVGELADPLLATWRVGLGKTTAWTSDGGERWASDWASWDGYADFWSAVVRDTFPLSGSAGESIDASIAGELLTIRLEGSEPWPTGTSPVARVANPDGTVDEVRLERRSDFEFEAVVPAGDTGVYAVGVGIEGDGERAVVLSTVAARSFGAEYLPGDPDPDLMDALSEATGGRGEITAADVFDGTDLAPGAKPFNLGWLFLLLAALLWPFDVAMRRLRLTRRARPSPPARSTAPPARPREPAAGGRR